MKKQLPNDQHCNDNRAILRQLEKVIKNIYPEHSPAGELEMQKTLSMVFKGAVRLPSMRAAK